MRASADLSKKIFASCVQESLINVTVQVFLITINISGGSVERKKHLNVQTLLNWIRQIQV